MQRRKSVRQIYSEKLTNIRYANNTIIAKEWFKPNSEKRAYIKYDVTHYNGYIYEEELIIDIPNRLAYWELTATNKNRRVLDIDPPFSTRYYIWFDSIKLEEETTNAQ